MIKKNKKLGIIGLGYVGLPLAVAFGKKRPTIGYDINTQRINELRDGIDVTRECSSGQIIKSKKLEFSFNEFDLKGCSIYIITVPTPVDEKNKPDFRPLISASGLVAKYLNKGDIVIYESTVYPGATEEICVPVLEKNSGLNFNHDFFCGYSPERINPGDKTNTLENIVKVTSGSSKKTAQVVDDLYKEIIVAGTHKASSIMVAEASKVIENTQRDVSIALVNELSMIFDKLGISTKDVLVAASTKWNFINFQPGLVGGHCIGVDPYYLISKAQQKGFYPELISASRKINEGMSGFVIDKMLKVMLQEFGSNPKKIAILGATFKENCPDIRNSQSFNLVNIANDLGIQVDIYDPYASTDECLANYNIGIAKDLDLKKEYECLIIAVGHLDYKNLEDEFFKKMQSNGLKLIFDIKGILDPNRFKKLNLKVISL